MKRRRVKITGIGPVTPAGIGRAEFWKGILEPVSRVRSFPKLDASLGTFAAAYLEKFSIAEYVEKSAVPKQSARHTLFAIAAASLAIKDAGLKVEDINSLNSTVVVGSSLMDFEGIGRTIEGVISKGVRGAQSRSVYTTNAAVIPASVVQVLGLNSRTMAIQTSCCAGMDAIGYAARMVSSGEAEIALCGGTEAPLFRCPLVELRATGLTPGTDENARKVDRPFDLWRTTGVVSEGACMIIIEPEDSPRKGYCRIDGYSFANDLSEDVCSGLQVAISHAIADAGIRTDSIEAINAWGPGHSRIDAAEVSVLRRIFGSRLGAIPVVSIKGALGNPLGAAPAMQIAVAALAMREGVLPPTVNWEYPDPACNLNLCSRSRFLVHDSVLVNAHGLSGVNASIVMQKC